MISRRVAIAGAVGTVCFGSAAALGGEPPLVGAPLPDLGVRLADGTEVRLQAWKGQALLLHFWATWCQPCIAELPKLEALHRKLQSTAGCSVLAVCIDEGPARPLVAKLMAGRGYTLPVAFEETGAAARLFGVEVLPVSWLVDPLGNVRKEMRGIREWDSDQWVTVLGDLRSQVPSAG